MREKAVCSAENGIDGKLRLEFGFRTKWRMRLPKNNFFCETSYLLFGLEDGEEIGFSSSFLSLLLPNPFSSAMVIIRE